MFAIVSFIFVSGVSLALTTFALLREDSFFSANIIFDSNERSLVVE